MSLDALIVSGYLGAMLVLGWSTRRQSAESYWVAERCQGSGAITISLLATVFGASSTFGVIGLAYARGLTAAWWSLVGSAGLLVFGLTLAGRVRSLEVYTLPDILHRAYGRSVAAPAAITIVAAWCGIVAAQMIAGARLLSAVLPLEYTVSLCMTAGAFILYTYWGGQLSVIRTDAWQLGLFVGGLVASAALVAASGGSSVIGALPRGHMQFPVSSGFGWYDLLVFYPLIVGLPYLAGPDIYSRVFCARDGSAARRAALAAAIAVVPLALLLALVGILLRAHFPGLVADAALPTAISELAPVGLGGLIVAGFLAAVMSSADTTLLSAATIFSLNVAGSGAGATHAEQLRLTRIAVLGVGAIAWSIAGLQEGIISSLMLAYTVFVGGVVAPTLASFWRHRLGVTQAGAMWAIVLGGTSAVIGVVRGGDFVRSLVGPEADRLLTGLLGSGYPRLAPFLLSIATLIVVSRLTRSRSRAGAVS